jgi:hypothetical protein
MENEEKINQNNWDEIAKECLIESADFYTLDGRKDYEYTYALSCIENAVIYLLAKRDEENED